MLDPSGFYSEYLASMAADLTLRVLNSVGRRLRETIKDTPRLQALVRCYQAGAAAMLPENDPVREIYHPILRDFFAQPAVDAELAKLIKGRQPDQETLAEAFTGSNKEKCNFFFAILSIMSLVIVIEPRN